MRTSIFLAAVILFGGMLAWGQAAPQAAKAELKDAQGQPVGNATFTQTPAGVEIAVTVTHLPPGTHGIHIHAVGQCEPPDFKSAGPHFNPTNKKHGLKNPEGHHAGDLRNLVVSDDGTGTYHAVDADVTLAPGPNSLLSPTGTSLVIHAAPDDDVTDPSGNSGARIACGVIVQQ